MVQKQAAYNRDPAGNAFADDDPLAELARLVGYDAPVARRIEPQVSTPPATGTGAAYAAPHQPVDLQNELLHDLDGYVDDGHAAPAPVHAAVAPQPQEQDIGSDASLADELLWSMSEVAVEPQRARPGGADPTGGYGSHRLPLANFNPVRTPPHHQEDPPMQRQEPVAPAPSVHEPSLGYGRTGFEELAAAPPTPSRQVEPDFDFRTAPAQRASDASFAIEPERRAATPAFQEPVFETQPAPRREAPSFFEDLSYQDEEQLAVPPQSHQPARAQEPVVEQAAEDDFFAGDLELDLSEIELDMSEFEPEPAIVRDEPRAARTEPELPPVVQRQAPAQPVYQAPAAPQAGKPELTRDMADEPPAELESVPPLPFDAAEISDQDDQLEVISHLDVPDLPPVDEEKPATYTPEYDFDIDAELANLLDKTAERAGQPAAPARAAAPASAAVPPIAEQVRNMPSDDFDVFEKALEEDFRRSLNTQYSFGTKQPGPVVEDLDDGDYEVEEERSSPRRWIAIAAAAAVVLVAGGGVFAWMKSTGSVALGGGEPKIVMADKDPVKVVPANPGGKSVPNQNKAVYDRVSGAASDQPSQKSLISSGEEPMDVAQRTLGPDDLPMDDEGGADAANANANPDANTANVAGAQAQPAAVAGDKQSLAPRRVKTMIVRPDGSLVAQDDAAAAPAGSTTQTGNSQQVASVKQPSGNAAPASTGQSVDDLLASGAAQPVATQADQPAEAQETAGVPAPNMPVPMARPTQTASAAAAPAKLAPPTAQASATPAASAASTTPAAVGGDYLIQIASLPSEADAQKSYKSLSAKFGSVIGGRGMDIKAADLPGKGTYYRVRIPAGSKEAAVSLCERYRSAGGSCMVVR